MLQIKYQNEFLDLASNTDGELEANSPLFLVDNVLAEYSTPITIMYSDKNARLIGPVFFNATIRNKIKLEVEVYKGDTYRCSATLVVESAALSRNARKSNASGYLLTGISTFFSLIKDVLLENLHLPQIPAKTFTTYDPYDGSDGVWQMIHATWNGDMDWMVAPVRNDNLSGDPDNPGEWMNQLGRGDFTGGTFEPRNQLMTGQYLAPFLRVQFIFKAIFDTFGWTFDDSSMTDAGYSKLFLFNSFAFAAFGADIYNFNLPYNYFLPKNTKASSFILAICRRYGWIPMCDAQSRTCTLIALKDCDKGQVKDWTIYAEPDIEADFTEEDKIYSFKNNFTGDDAGIDDVDITDKTQLTVESKFNLPAPTLAYDNTAFLAYRENKWYVTDVDGSNNRFWLPRKDNIYNDEPADANASVETDCTTLPMVWANYSSENGVNYWGLFPYCSIANSKQAGIRTFFYHGMVNEIKADGSPGIQTYPYLSSVSNGPDGTIVNEWANVFKHIGTDHSDNGIEQFWFSKWLQYMKNPEVKTQNFNLPLHELVNYTWNDIILVNNIQHLIISFTERLDMKGFIQAKLKRLIPFTE